MAKQTKIMTYKLSEWQKLALGTVSNGWTLVSINQSSETQTVSETWEK